MKKYLFLFSIICLGVTSIQAQQKQGLKLEANLGIAVGEYSNATVFGLGADMLYLFNVSGSFQLGPSVGYQTYFGRGTSLPPAMTGGREADIQFLPMALTSRYYFFDELFLGADVGYGLGLNEGNDGGFLYKPKVGFSFGLISTILSYTGVVGEFDTFNSVNIGFEVAF